MTPERWAAMTTAANQDEGHAWLAFGVGVAVGAVVLWFIVGGVVWWRNEQLTRAKQRTFDGRTWR